MKARYTVHSDEVRELCIRHRYYTAGDTVAYSNMFEMCRQAQTLESILRIAEDIKEHSNTDDTAEDIAEYIANFCAYTEIVNDDTTSTGDPLPFVVKLIKIQSKAEELAQTIARRNPADGFICSECLHTIGALLDIYEEASNPEAVAELREELEAITGTDLY